MGYYDTIKPRSKGAWVVHHGQKTAATINGAAEFPALDAAGKAASLLSQIAASDQAVLPTGRVEALAKAAGLNPRIELPAYLKVLEEQRVVQLSQSGDVEVLGLTSAAAVQHAAEIFERQKPTSEEQASVALAELTSSEPVLKGRLAEFLGDEFRLTTAASSELLQRSETVGFVDAEGRDADRLYFNGNLFRRDSVEKAKRVFDSLRDHERAKVNDLDALLSRAGCASVAEAEQILGGPLFDKLKAAGMYDMNIVANPSGETGFITKPSAFHKFNDPLTDDAFDLAKALVSALYYGMTQSSAGRGRIGMISALLRKLILGAAVGPATAIGEDYRVLETKGVLSVQRASSYGYTMRLLKRDVGEMALRVLTTGDTASLNVIDRPLPGTMSGYSGPERSRTSFRRKQVSESKKLTHDVLQSLRTSGKFS